MGGGARRGEWERWREAGRDRGRWREAGREGDVSTVFVRDKTVERLFRMRKEAQSICHTAQFSAFHMESVDYVCVCVCVLKYVRMCVRAFANWRCGHGRNGPARAWENDDT